MVNLENLYCFSAEEVAAIGTSEIAGSTHQFALTVYLKNENKFSVRYVDSDARNAAMHNLERQIDREKKQDFEKMHNKLFLLQDAINRVDKRQLRIWRQLKALLGVETEGE